MFKEMLLWSKLKSKNSMFQAVVCKPWANTNQVKLSRVCRCCFFLPFWHQATIVRASQSAVAQCQLIQWVVRASPCQRTCPPAPSVALGFLTHTHRYIYVYIYMVVDQNSFIPKGHSARIKTILSRNFRELHVYLSRGPCWPTTPLMKIRSPPAKLRQRITDHFLVAFQACS